MNCVNCNMDINPKWSHAIEMNVCPGCGNHIMEEHLKNLFIALKDTMNKLQQYPDQLNDWMLSNHNYLKTDSPNLPNYLSDEYLRELKKFNSVKEMSEKNDKKFTIKMTNENGEEQEIVAEKIQSEEKTNEFFKRAEAVKPRLEGFKSVSEKTQRLKELAQHIKKEGSVTINQAGTSEIISPEMMENADPDAVAEYQSIINNQSVGGDVSSSDYDNNDDIPFVVQQMTNIAGSKQAGADLAKLQKQQSRNIDSRRNFNSGKGNFSRG